MPSTTTQPTPQQTPSASRQPLRIKSMTVGGLHRAAKLLGGTEERMTNGHNYIAYRLPGGRQAQLPKPTGNGNGITGRGHLKEVLTQFLDAGIPHKILEQALSDAGAIWHEPPKRNTRILKRLKNQPELVRDARWDLIDPTPTPTQPTTPQQEPTSMSKTRKASQPDKRVWCGLDLNEVVQLDLPAGVSPTILNFITRTISRNFTVGIEPFASLMRDGNVTRTRENKRYVYEITESAAAILAAEARKHYDTHHADTTPEAPVPETTHTAPDSAPQNTPTPKTNPETTEQPTPRFKPQQALALNEAIGELIRRHGVTPPLDDNLRLDLQQFIIELEQATRPN